MIHTTELLIARHGEAHCNRQQIIGGPAGCRGLTDRGRRQIERLARRLTHQHHDQPIHALYTSPLRRALESAAIIGAYLGLDPKIEADLAEQHHGTADGKPWIEVVAAYGDIPALAPDRPLATDGETWQQYLDRARHTLATITASHHGERILIIGHGETTDAAFHHFLNLPATTRATAAIVTHYAALTTWQQKPLSWTKPTFGLRWTLVAHNDTRHVIP